LLQLVELVGPPDELEVVIGYLPNPVGRGWHEDRLLQSRCARNRRSAAFAALVTSPSGACLPSCQTPLVSVPVSMGWLLRGRCERDPLQILQGEPLKRCAGIIRGRATLGADPIYVVLIIVHSKVLSEQGVTVMEDIPIIVPCEWY
jgi:hypothetical protein